MYKPTNNDLIWIKKLIGSLKDGGFWGYKSESIIVQFFHSKKQYSFLARGIEESDEYTVVKDPNIERVNAVMSKLNWREV